MQGEKSKSRKATECEQKRERQKEKLVRRRCNVN